jgi:hypothetical protein
VTKDYAQSGLHWCDESHQNSDLFKKFEEQLVLGAIGFGP